MQQNLSATLDPTRCTALAILWEGGAHCVCALMARRESRQSRVSRHLKFRRVVGLVTDRCDAQWVGDRRASRLSPEVAAVVAAVLVAERSEERAAA